MKKITLLLMLFLPLNLYRYNTEKTIFAADIAYAYKTELESKEIKEISNIVRTKFEFEEFGYELISSFSYCNRYVLIEGNDYYLIYDRMIADYTEYSTSTKSIYSLFGEIKNKLYIGPSYYFSEKNGKIKNLLNNQFVKEDEIKKYNEIEKNIFNNFTNNFEQRKNSSASNGIKYVPNKYYFDNLAKNTGDNNYASFFGSCGYVAAEMLLTYYDSILSDAIIDERYDAIEMKQFSTYYDIKTSEYSESPGIDNRFHSYIISLGKKYGYTDGNEYSISLTNICNLFDKYFTNKNIDAVTYETGIFTNKINFCKNAIDLGNPVIIQIIGVDQTLDPRDLNHAVVGYGYDDTGIFVNFGWKGINTNVNINKYSIEKAIYINIPLEHECGNNYIWQFNDCNGTICVCGEKTCNHNNKNIYQNNSKYHKVQCRACSNYVLEEHNFHLSDGINVCKECNYKIENNHVHKYVYIPRGDGRFHISKCDCGDEIRETCFGINTIGGNSVCIKCGQNIISFKTMKKDEDR